MLNAEASALSSAQQSAFGIQHLALSDMASSRPDRVGDQIRTELALLIAREVHDPGVGFLTLTRVQVTPDLQLARVYYTSLGDENAQRETARALRRAAPFLRRHLGQRIRLRRVPELEFFYDESIARNDRIEQILRDLKAERHEPIGDDDPGDQ